MYQFTRHKKMVFGCYALDLALLIVSLLNSLCPGWDKRRRLCRMPKPAVTEKKQRR